MLSLPPPLDEEEGGGGLDSKNPNADEVGEMTEATATGGGDAMKPNRSTSAGLEGTGGDGV